MVNTFLLDAEVFMTFGSSLFQRLITRKMRFGHWLTAEKNLEI